MSDPPPAREWRFYLDDMIAFTEKVLSYTVRDPLATGSRHSQSIDPRLPRH